MYGHADATSVIRRFKGKQWQPLVTMTPDVLHDIERAAHLHEDKENSRRLVEIARD